MLVAAAYRFIGGCHLGKISFTDRDGNESIKNMLLVGEMGRRNRKSTFYMIFDVNPYRSIY